jgi:hypothetical protein
MKMNQVYLNVDYAAQFLCDTNSSALFVRTHNYIYGRKRAFFERLRHIDHDFFVVLYHPLNC